MILPENGQRRGTAAGFLLLLLTLVLSAPATAAENWGAFDGLISKSQKEMMADPNAALTDARAAEGLAQNQAKARRYQRAIATALWLEAEALTRTNRPLEAQPLLLKAASLAATDGKLTKLDGDIALSRARLADSRGDVARALKNYQRAHAIFVRLRIARSQALALQGLGMIYDEAHDYAHEINYYQEALKVYSEPALALTATNNLGFAMQQMGRYDEAIDHYRRALKLAEALNSPMLQARILTNIAMSRARQHKLAEAERAANHALRLLGPKDESGWAPFAWSVKADIEYQRAALKLAVADIDRTFHGVDLRTTIAPFHDAHDIAYKIYRAAGDLPLAMTHLEAFKRLDDEGRSLAASANLALIGAQFDFANQQLEIEHLKSAQLQRDISLRKSHAATQSVIFAAVLLAGIFLLIWMWWRHSMVARHRNAITQKNVELVKTLAERDGEIERRTEIESQLRFAMETAQQASRAKSHFLANMSHELRTPLNAIIGFSELMMSDKLKPEKTREYASDVAEGGRHLLAILNDVLDMARIEAGKLVLEEEPVRLSEVVENTIAVLGCDRRSDGKQVCFADANRDLVIRADALRLRQILINLVSNALKFTDNDGRIDISIERLEDGVNLVVADNGKGIPPEMLGLIMEPFGQAENTYARSHGGAGLGLPIVKSLAELHGGALTIESELDQGTTARVHLPRERLIGGAVPGQEVRRQLTQTAAA
jgi:signal transduction histidine kinase/tetratricopeptide (TPR) repeat protein